MTEIDQAEPCLNPSEILPNIIVILLTPMFIGLCAGDIAIARMAAFDTISAYRARNHVDLIAIAQIIGFGLAALGSLSLSMADDISIALTLRLRGNANACNRSAEQNRRALAKSQAADPKAVVPEAPAPEAPAPEAPAPEAVAPEAVALRAPAPEAVALRAPGPVATNPMPHPAAEPRKPETEFAPAEFDLSPERDGFLSAAAEQQLAAESQARLQFTDTEIPVPPPVATPRTPTEKHHQEMWAIAMAKESSEITARIPNLPPAEQQAAAMHAATLSTTAHDLLYGTPPMPLNPDALAHMIRPDFSPPAVSPKAL